MTNNLDYYYYNKDTRIHVIDYSGEICYAEGLSRMDELEKVFDSFGSRAVLIKVLFDVRNTIWENQQVHDALSRISRQKFSKYSNLYMAVLNNQFEFSTYKNECWFTKKEEAFNWLMGLE